MNITKNQPFSKAVTYDSALSAYAKLLFYTLERLVGGDGCVQATVDYLAQLMGTSARTVMRYTPVLEKAGYITVVRAPRNSKIPNIYRLGIVTESHSKVSDSPIASNGNVWSSPVESPMQTAVQHPHPSQALPHSSQDLPQLEGMTHENMAKLVAQHGLERVKAAVDYAQKQTNLYNKPGFVVRVVQGKIQGVDLRTVSDEDRRMRYVTGKYAHFIQW